MPKPSLRRPQRTAKSARGAQDARPARPPRPAVHPVLEVRVADVDVDGQVRLLVTAPQTVRVQAGQRVRLVCTYRFKTASSHTESCELAFGAVPPRGAPQGSNVRSAASAEGTLECLVGAAAGEVRWSVEVAFEVRHWGGGQLLHSEREQAAGVLSIVRA